MDDLLAQAMTRRRLLKTAAAGAAAAGAVPLLGAAPASARSSAGNIKMWWWGDQEAIGILAWINDTIKKFQSQTGAKVSATQMDVSQVIPQFTKAAAAGNVPDVQFLFNGIYHMENVWLGYIAPLNGLVAPATISKGGGTKLSQYDGKTYRTGFYDLAFGIQYNKEHFDKAGLNADSPPKTWDEFLDAADKLKTAGYTPLGGGVKDGFLGEWWLINSLTQNLNSAADALNLFIGKLDWREPKYHEHWIKLQQLKDEGFWNDDVNSLSLYQGIQLFDTGKASMALNNTPALPDSQKKLGKDNVGFMKMPTFGTGKMAPYADRRHAGLRHPGQGQGPGDGGQVHRLHAHARAPAGLLDALEADPGRLALRPRRDRQPAAQGAPTTSSSGQAQRLHRRPDADAVLDRRDVRDLAEDPRRQHEGRRSRATWPTRSRRSGRSRTRTRSRTTRPGATT